MVFINTDKLTGLLVTVITCVLSAQARLEARAALAEVSVVFYDDVNLLGASYSPAEISPGVCQTLPGNWLDRAESLEIGSGYTCNFYVYAGCEGVGKQLSGTVDGLSMTSTPPLYNNIESFSCNKQIA